MRSLNGCVATALQKMMCRLLKVSFFYIVLLFVDAMANNSDSINFQCSFCGNGYEFFGKLARHISLYHENVPQFSITCVVRGCKNSYRSVESLRKHMQHHHRQLLSVTGNNTSSTSCECSAVGTSFEGIGTDAD